MKELDRTKAYDLRDLNDEQLRELLEWLKANDEEWEYFTNCEFKKYNLLGFSTNLNEWCFNDYGKEIINALTLFEPKLKISDTFEKDGFICRVESEVMKWYVVDRGLDAYYTTLTEEVILWLRSEDVRVEEITDQEFIKQLEKHAR